MLRSSSSRKEARRVDDYKHPLGALFVVSLGESDMASIVYRTLMQRMPEGP
jgi:hypothetical protein